MSGIDERMVHSQMTAMADAFKQAAQTLKQTQDTSKKISKMLADGALLGDGGKEFENAINTKLLKALTTLESKMTQLQSDIKKAQDANREAEGTARGRFQN